MEPLDQYSRIQPFVQKDARAAARAMYEELGTRYGVASVPYHEHNGVDAPYVPFSNVRDRQVYIHWTLPGTSAATAANYGVFWVAPFACSVVEFTEVHQTAGSDPGTVTLQLEKLTGTQAPNSGIELLSTAIDLKATANTVQYGAFTRAYTSNVRRTTLARGDRLCLKDAGTLTSVANVTTITTVQF